MMNATNPISLHHCHMTPSLPPSIGDSSTTSVEAMISEYHQVLDQIHLSHPSRKKIVTFPVKLYLILQLAPKYDLDHIISWQAHGRNFVIRNRSLFLNQIAHRIFETTKFASLQRQLNVYDFQIVPSKHKTDKGAYYHPQFLRGRLDLSHTIARVRVGGERRLSFSSQSSSTLVVPNFYALPYCYDPEDGPSQLAASGQDTTEVPSDHNSSKDHDGPQMLYSHPNADPHSVESIKDNGSQQGIPLRGALSAETLHHEYKSEFFQEKSVPNQKWQHATWNMLDKLERTHEDQFVKNMTLLDGLLQQHITVPRPSSRPPITPEERGSHCVFRTTGERNALSAFQVDWNNAYTTEGKSIYCNADNDASWFLFPNKTQGEARQETRQMPFRYCHPSTITLEQALGVVGEQHITSKEEEIDDFHGHKFHDVEHDADSDGAATWFFDECR